LHVLTVIEKIIRIQKIKRPPRKGWSLKNIADFAENTLPIRKQNKEKSYGWESDVGVWHRRECLFPFLRLAQIL
jgi:hypothetical protein